MQAMHTKNTYEDRKFNKIHHAGVIIKEKLEPI